MVLTIRTCFLGKRGEVKLRRMWLDRVQGTAEGPCRGLETEWEFTEVGQGICCYPVLDLQISGLENYRELVISKTQKRNKFMKTYS